MKTVTLLAPKDNLCFPDYRDNRALADDIGGFFRRMISGMNLESLEPL